MSFQVSPQFVELLETQFPGGVDNFASILNDAAELSMSRGRYDQSSALFDVLNDIDDVMIARG